MREEIVKFLLENGETTIPQMKFKNITRPQLNNMIIKMFQKGLVDRRLVMTSRSDMWAYYAIKPPEHPYQFKNEPEVVYFLRNLPRENFLPHSINLLESRL
jgi:hypothetical protein